MGFTFASWAVMLAVILQTMDPSTPSTVDARAVAVRAISQAHAVAVSPFLRYTYSVSLTHKATTKSYSYAVLERLADHFARFTSLNADGTPSQDIHLHKTLVSPALFLKVVKDEPEPADSPAPKVIGRVETFPYTASLAGYEDVVGCGSAYHLRLVPIGDPGAHSLRDLWIEPRTFRICRADIAMSVDIISRETVTVDVAIGADDYVESWKFEGKGHTPVGTYELAATGSFSGMTTLSDANPSLFR